MPAKNLFRERKEGTYAHIYNKGVEKRVIFNDEEDYKAFQGFLKDYLSPPQDPESIKKSFTVHGRVFRGTPHQPKNYFNKVELIAYSLRPDHFHLLLHQVSKGSLESFIRSLCTRYSIYFNKRYQRTGSLFEGPYKSVKIKNESSMLHLTRSLHRANGHSSYAQYLGNEVIPWVDTKIVLSFFGKAKTDLLKGADSYRDFVEKYEPDQKVRKLLEAISFENENQHLGRRDLARGIKNDPPEISAESSEKIHLDRNLKPLQRIPEFLATSVIFLLLFTLGIRNIMVTTTESPSSSALGTNIVVSTTEAPNPSTASAVLSETKKIEKIEEVKPKIMLIIKTDDASASASVNIRQKPTTDSEKIGAAKNGDTFEFLSVDSEWYEVKLATQSGFISAEYIEVMEEINE